MDFPAGPTDSPMAAVPLRDCGSCDANAAGSRCAPNRVPCGLSTRLTAAPVVENVLRYRYGGFYSGGNRPEDGGLRSGLGQAGSRKDDPPHGS